MAEQLQNTEDPVRTEHSAYPPTIAELALQFVRNLEIRFGAHSRESATIYGTLGRFGRGEIPKRDALSIVASLLDGHYDLKHELMKILNHEDSRWVSIFMYELQVSPNRY